MQDWQGKRCVSRPAARWVDNIVTVADPTWTRLAQDQGRWHSKKKAGREIKKAVYDE